MKSITELSESVRVELEKNPEGAWQWFSEQHYAEQVSQNRNHLLVRIRQGFEVSKLVSACAGYRLYAGKRGQAASYALGLLGWALLLKHLMGWSYRVTCCEIHSHSLYRWFVGYRLDEAVFSYVTLQRFAVYVETHCPRRYFDEILNQIDEDYPDDAQAAQVGDTFALVSRATEQSRTELLRTSCRRLLGYLQQVQPELHAKVLGLLNQEQLFGRADERAEFLLDKSERDACELRTALAADSCLVLVWSRVAQLPKCRTVEFLAMQRWLGLLDKALYDEYRFAAGAEADSLSVRFCSKKERGQFVMGSSHDPEASFRKHGEKTQLGFNVQVAASERFIREIFAQTGATSDGSGVAPLLARQLAQRGTVPPKLIYDRAAGSPKTYHDVAQASHGKTQLVARLIDHTKNSERFGPLDFTLNADGSLTCPNGQSTATSSRSQSAEGYEYRFPAQTCVGCPLRQPCRGELPPVLDNDPAQQSAQTAPATPTTKPKRKTPKPDSCRQVFISAYREQQHQAILYTKTEAFQQDMRFRSTIERIIAALVRYNHARRAHGYGTRKADFQVKMAATAYNLKKWHRLTLQPEKALPYQPPDSS